MPAVSDLQLEPHQAVEGDERAEIRITMPHLPSTGGTRGSDCLQALLLGRGGPGVASSHGKSPGPMNARAPYADSPLVYSSHFCFPRKKQETQTTVSPVFSTSPNCGRGERQWQRHDVSARSRERSEPSVTLSRAVRERVGSGGRTVLSARTEARSARTGVRGQLEEPGEGAIAELQRLHRAPLVRLV